MVPNDDDPLKFLDRERSSEEIIAFRANDDLKLRVADLIRREKLSLLTGGELDELNRCMEFDKRMTLAKARAHLRLRTRQSGATEESGR
jgi:hypothetical protein